MNLSFNSNMMGFRTKRQKFGVGSLLFLLVFGAIFTGPGFFALSSTKVDPSWKRSSGKIVDASSSINDGSTTYAPVVSYNVDGQSYRVSGNVQSGSYPHIGEMREVAYNPNHPNQSKVVETASSLWFLYLFPLIGVFLLVLAPFLFIRSLKRSKVINNLMQSGQKLQGVLVDVQSQDTGHNHTYKIVVSATDTGGKVQNYVSDSITGIGGLAMADFRNSPIPIDVYIDSTDPENYYVDIADIPNLTPERIAELIKSAVKNRQSNTTAEGEKPSLAQPNVPTLPPSDLK